MKFKSPTHEPVSIALTSGHTCCIGPELVEIDARFHREAVAAGCIPEGMDAVAQAPASETTKSTLIDRAVAILVEKGDDKDFTKDGKPDSRQLSHIAGFQVTSDERDEAWERFEETTG